MESLAGGVMARVFTLRHLRESYSILVSGGDGEVVVVAAAGGGKRGNTWRPPHCTKINLRDTRRVKATADPEGKIL